MSERLTLRLYEPVQAHGAMRQAWDQHIKPLVCAGHRLVLEVRPENRTLDQVDAIITDPPYSSGGMVRGDRLQT